MREQFLERRFHEEGNYHRSGNAGLASWLGNRAGAKANDAVCGTTRGKAQTPGGGDASASFNAGIADENTIPDVMPAN
jgi:hypothetical protein